LRNYCWDFPIPNCSNDNTRKAQCAIHSKQRTYVTIVTSRHAVARLNTTATHVVHKAAVKNAFHVRAVLIFCELTDGKEKIVRFGKKKLYFCNLSYEGFPKQSLQWVDVEIFLQEACTYLSIKAKKKNLKIVVAVG
jgi:hypothetical protein